ncbi:MAG: potassium transporter, partial [Alphaproteobacteria bacterium]|nr:potassium transporter [Alphaproteobacteria bacterium]
MIFVKGRRRAFALAGCTIVIFALSAEPALAAAVTGSGKTEAIFVLQVILLLAVGRLLGEGLQRLGQPAIMGQLLAGILLGPSFFGFLLPDLQKAVFPSTPEQQAMINAVSQLG